MASSGWSWTSFSLNSERLFVAGLCLIGLACLAAEQAAITQRQRKITLSVVIVRPFVEQRLLQFDGVPIGQIRRGNVAVAGVQQRDVVPAHGQASTRVAVFSCRLTKGVIDLASHFVGSECLPAVAELFVQLGGLEIGYRQIGL